MAAGARGVRGDAAAWRSLAGPEAPLLESLEGIEAPPAPSVIERLRALHPADAVAAAIELSIARTRARAKFGERARTLWCDRQGVEMASGPRVARRKAARFAEAGASEIDDLCCGIGGDLIELARVARATGIDRDPVRAWMAAMNSGAPTTCSDALREPGSAPFAHADPARRDGTGARVTGSDALEPPVAALRAALAGRRGFALKIGPGMDLAASELDGADELEFLSEDGRLVQQVVWSGALAASPGMRRATKACTGLTVAGRPDPVPLGDGCMQPMLMVPDPALERARLLGVVATRIGAVEPAPGLGIVTARSAPADPAALGWFEAFEVVDELPARESTVAGWLAARGAGIVTVRTRGDACDPDRWQSRLRGRGDEPWTVFVLRVGDRRRAYAVRRAGGA